MYNYNNSRHAEARFINNSTSSVNTLEGFKNSNIVYSDYKAIRVVVYSDTNQNYVKAIDVKISRSNYNTSTKADDINFVTIFGNDFQVILNSSKFINQFVTDGSFISASDTLPSGETLKCSVTISS